MRGLRSTVADSDLIVCLSKGEVAEVGSPQDCGGKGRMEEAWCYQGDVITVVINAWTSP